MSTVSFYLIVGWELIKARMMESRRSVLYVRSK